MSENKVVLLGTKGGPRMEKGLSWSTCSVIEVDGHPYIVDCGLRPQSTIYGLSLIHI